MTDHGAKMGSHIDRPPAAVQETVMAPIPENPMAAAAVDAKFD